MPALSNKKAFQIDAEQIKEYSKVKLPMPVLALGGENSFGTASLVSMQSILQMCVVA